MTFHLINQGIYTVPEAARLSEVSPGRVRRWLKGYDFRVKDHRHHSRPVWQGQHATLHGKQAVGFRDLMEIRFVSAFLRAGVSWKTMRAAHEAARRELLDDHPFCSNRFVTDGKHILMTAAQTEGDEILVDLLNHQAEFQKIVQPFLKELEFTDDAQLLRWWPMGRDRSVVVDPARNLGQPTSARGGVPTRVLARSVKANKSPEEVARWYEVEPAEVHDAMEFETHLAA